MFALYRYAALLHAAPDATIDARDPEGRTPLAVACAEAGPGSAEVALTLVEWGADVAAAAQRGRGRTETAAPRPPHQALPMPWFGDSLLENKRCFLWQWLVNVHVNVFQV